MDPSRRLQLLAASGLGRSVLGIAEFAVLNPDDWEPHEIQRGHRKGTTVWKHKRNGSFRDEIAGKNLPGRAPVGVNKSPVPPIADGVTPASPDTSHPTTGKSVQELQVMLGQAGRPTGANPWGLDAAKAKPTVTATTLHAVTDATATLADATRRAKIADVYRAVQTSHPDLSLTDFQNSLLALRQDQKINLGAYTLASATIPPADLKTTFPLDHELKYYVEPTPPPIGAGAAAPPAHKTGDQVAWSGKRGKLSSGVIEDARDRFATVRIGTTQRGSGHKVGDRVMVAHGDLQPFGIPVPQPTPDARAIVAPPLAPPPIPATARTKTPQTPKRIAAKPATKSPKKGRTR